MESWPMPNVLPSGSGWDCRQGTGERQSLCAGRFATAAAAATAAREPCDANAESSGCNAAGLQDIEGLCRGVAPARPCSEALVDY